VDSIVSAEFEDFGVGECVDATPIEEENDPFIV
jgi:hypothetical protein